MSVSLAGYKVLPWVESAACLCCTVLVVGVLASIQAAPHGCPAFLALCTPATGATWQRQMTESCSVLGNTCLHCGTLAHHGEQFM